MFTQGLLAESEIPPDILHQKAFLQKFDFSLKFFNEIN